VSTGLVFAMKRVLGLFVFLTMMEELCVTWMMIKWASISTIIFLKMLRIIELFCTYFLWTVFADFFF